ncbi:MAG: FkbM family methyltransferase [Helicobacteraceae bacterium]|jgi:FkbM family methyltransferase|nr:FkbM family methyltransferase [Helicobacteraceae bacterium]
MGDMANTIRRIKRTLWQITHARQAIAQKIDNSANATMLFIRLFAQMYSGVNFRGQLDQDLLAYLYFKGKKNGFYLDIGAHDGLSINNTYVFERLGWRGACVEPLPDIFERLRQNRKCDCYNVAISDQTEDNVDFIKVGGGGTNYTEMFSGLEARLPSVRKKNIKSCERIKVKTMTFDDLMKNYPDVTHIDFLSIDVEGAEMSILKSIDFTKYTFGLMAAENNEEVIGQGDELKAFMLDNGYDVLLEHRWDIFFMPIK